MLPSVGRSQRPTFPNSFGNVAVTPLLLALVNDEEV